MKSLNSSFYIFYTLLSLSVSSVEAITLGEIADKIGLPEEKLKVTYLKAESPDTIWSIEVRGVEPNSIHPLSLTAFKFGSRVNDQLRRDVIELKEGLRPGSPINVNIVELESGYLVAGIPFLSPNVSAQFCLISLPSHKVDLEVAVGTSSNTPNPKRDGWNDVYNKTVEEGINIASFLEEIGKKIAETEIGNLQEFTENQPDLVGQVANDQGIVQTSKIDPKKELPSPENIQSKSANENTKKESLFTISGVLLLLILGGFWFLLKRRI